MFKRGIILSALLSIATSAGAYEKIDFKNQLLNPAFMKLSAVAVGGGHIYAADAKANCVFIFDADGKFVKKAEGGFKAPQGLAFGDGRLYVADTGGARVVVMDADGKLLWAFSGEGDAPGQLSGPRGVAYGPDSRVYVSDTGNSRVDVFNSDGVYLYGFPALKADGVTKLKPARIAVSYDGGIYIADPDLALVQKYDRSGKLLREYPMPCDGIAPDLNGFLYVISSKEGKVREVVSATGEVAGSFGTRGKGKMEFRKLTDIAADNTGLLYLCDDENKKVVTISLEGSEGARLELAPLLDRFTVKGPVAKAPFKAEVFAVTPAGDIVAWLPETRELALLAGTVKKTLVQYGSLQGQLKNPRGLFVDAKGLIYAADTGNDRVQIFNPDGTYYNMFGESGSGEGQFRGPSAVAVNSKGNIYVADTKNKKIKAFSADGMFLFSAGPQLGSITLASPVAVRCDESRNVYILDSVLKKVIVTDTMGKFLRAWDDSGSLQDPASLANDGKGFFYILDKGSFNIKIFDGDGKFTAAFFAKGRGERELWTPQYLAFRNDRVYISDTENARITAFDISYLPEPPAGLKAALSGEKVSLSWPAKTNAWTAGFKVFRTASAGGELKEVGETKEKAFTDTGLAPDATYYYRVAAVSATGARGGFSPEAQVYVKARELTKAELAAAERHNAPVEILPVALNYIFSANYKNYLKNPVGRIEIQNNTDYTFTNVKVSFSLRDFMDYPTDTVVPEIAPHSKAPVDIMATLNNKVLNITEDTPIQCQLTVTWYQDGVEKTTTINKPIKVLSKNAIVWDNAQRLANFITPKDTPVFGFSRFALNEKSKIGDEASDLNDSVVTAALLWEALGEQGLSYLADPVSPYAVLKSSGEAALDTVQFPRTTLKLKSGDCDDLTALFASLLEASGVHVALLDYPAHISLMFDTGVTDPREAGLPAEYLIKYNNTYWVGLEETMVGKDMYDAIKHAADFYRKNESVVKVIEVRSAWAEFEPVTLPETFDENYPDRDKFLTRAHAGIAALLKARYNYFKDYFGRILLEDPEDLDANLNMGILSAKQGEAAPAQKYFESVLAREPFNAAALNNLGNLAFQGEKYEEARTRYFAASKADPYDADIWLNLARVSDKLGKKEDVKTFAERAAKIDPAVKNIGDMLVK